MFTPEQRTQLRSELLAWAADDKRIASAAVTGSAAAGREDRWSDVDLAFGVADAAQLPEVLSDWTARMYAGNGAVHHLDVTAGAWIYRVFLLANGLQVDLAFVPAAEFRALAPTFQLVFGAAGEPGSFPAPAPGDVAGYGWLYAVHARSCIARGKLWQAELMVSAIRDHGLTLACLRHGLPAAHGRGIDALPAQVLEEWSGSLVRALEPAELERAFAVCVRGLAEEIRRLDSELGERLGGVLGLLIAG